MNRSDEDALSGICWAGAALSLIGCLISIYRLYARLNP